MSNIKTKGNKGYDNSFLFEIKAKRTTSVSIFFSPKLNKHVVPRLLYFPVQ